MRGKHLFTVFFIPFLISISNSYAQNQNGNDVFLFGKTINKRNIDPDGLIRCATTEYEASLRRKDPHRLSSEEFEKWLNPKIRQLKRKKANGRIRSTIITIPVVVHVIHNGDEYGTGENITDEQVQSQIAVLNQDFRRMTGTPGFNNNIVGADIEIEFCLAGSDPNGNKTNGINRVNLNITDFGEQQVETILKPQTQWNPEEYLNIWTCRFGKGNGGDDNLERVLGYAQFPSSSNLPGLSPNMGNAITDGVIISYNAFGSATIYPQGTYSPYYNQGRTTTHEIGHWLGLIHIWGDSSNCNIDDFCADTPATNKANTICIEHASCTPRDMIENYMDYTPDACMNIFTQDQKIRMQTVLLNSPRRKSLVNSLKCEISNVTTPDNLKVIQVYPNPTQDILNISIPESSGKVSNYFIYNYLGQTVERVQVLKNTDLNLNVSKYNAGVYFIKIHTNRQTKTLRFIKK